MIWLLLALSPISGIAGRLGGCGKQGQWYDFIAEPKVRDVGCSALITLSVAFYTGFSLSLVWCYSVLFLLHWGALSTYWDWLFKGVDNLWFSGFMVGLALLPVAFVVPGTWWMILLRAVFLGLWWGCLNKFLPQKITIWRRDVAEEFLRYAVLI